jgi:hypothetical protein
MTLAGPSDDWPARAFRISVSRRPHGFDRAVWSLLGAVEPFANFAAPFGLDHSPHGFRILPSVSAVHAETKAAVTILTQPHYIIRRFGMASNTSGPPKAVRIQAFMARWKILLQTVHDAVEHIKVS